MKNKENKRILAAAQPGIFFRKREKEPLAGLRVKLWFDSGKEKFSKPLLFAGKDQRFFTYQPILNTARM